MALWKTGEDRHGSERTDERFIRAGAAARLLYEDAGGWAMQQVFGKRYLPDRWFIPAAKVREWGKKNAAAALVREGLWEKVQLDGRAGYVYVWIRWENTPRFIQQQRDEYRREHARKVAARTRVRESDKDGTTGG